MRREYAPLSTIRLEVGVTTFERPREPPPLVHLDDPALDVMTDFRHLPAITTVAGQAIDDALALMKRAGVRLLLVVDEDEMVIGTVTASDIQGERPIRLAESDRTARSGISVGAVMTGLADAQVLDYHSVCQAQVGQILETLKSIERRHVLVAEGDQAPPRRVRGLFSASQIAKQLGTHLEADAPTAHSLAKILHEFSGRRGDRAIGEIWSGVVEHD